MGIHELTLGLNGSGKTLVTVATKLLPLVGKKIEYETSGGQKRSVDVRLVVGGVRDLLVPHELMEVPEIDPESFVDEWGPVKRDPGAPAVRFVRRVGSAFVACDESDEGAEPVVCSIVNWWVWCLPGDVITVDEAQRVYRPMASGRRVPRFLAKAETARHYGVRFQYITQHPGLLHANLRALVGPIEEVSRVFGSSSVLIRQWDKLPDYGKKALATARYWKHDKKAFGLYKSAELHTKFSARIPLAVYAVVAGLVALGVTAWVLKNRLAERFSPPAAAQASAGASSARGGPEKTSNGQSVARWPVYDSGPAVLEREPYEARALQFEGAYTVGAVSYAVFGLLVDGERVATTTLAQLVRMGYRWTDLGPCAGVLRYKDRERVVTCGKSSRVERRDVAVSTAPAASAPL